MLRRPHAVAAAVRAHQHVEQAVVAFVERELVDRRARGLQRARRRAVERDAEHRRGRCVRLRAAPPGRGPDEDRARRDVEHASRRAEHRGALARHLRLGEVADRHAVQRDALERVERLVGAVDPRGRGDAFELGGERARTPPAHRRERRVRVAAPRVETVRRIEDELRADQPARVVARRVVVVRAQVIGRLVGELARARDLEQADLGAAARVAVADHDDGVAGDEHLVVPRAARIDVSAERVGGGHRPQVAVADPHREEPPAPQDHEVVAVHLDDPAFVDAGVLDVGDRLVLGGRLGRLGRGRRGGRRRLAEQLRSPRARAGRAARRGGAAPRRPSA